MTTTNLLPLVIKPKFYRNFISRVVRRQGSESINALDCPCGRYIQGRNTARLLDLHILGRSVACNVEGQIDPIRRRDPRIDFILQPVLRDLLLYHLHVPGKAVAEIAASTGESKSPLGSASSEHAVRPADWASFAIRDLVRFLGLWLSFAFCRAGDRLGFDLCILIRDRDRFGFLLLNFRRSEEHTS